MLQLRPYQQQAVDAVYNHLRTRDDNPCVVLPTGTGKSLVIAQIATDAVQRWFGRVLILAHVKELLEQNADKIQRLCPDLNVGIYSAGLNSRDTSHSVIVAGIQSVYKRAAELGPFDLAIQDECHLLSPDSDTMYQSFFKDMKELNPNLRIIGLTATPFRMKGGVICKPENLLNHICYEAGLKDMIAQGYLAKLISKSGRAEANWKELHIRGGEFVANEVEAAMDEKALVSSACHEIVSLTRERKSVLIFTSGVAHCQHVAEKIAEYSYQECAVVTGDTPAWERAEILARFKGEKVADDFFADKPPLKYLANVNVLTTGFDAANTDCVVLLRPTNSAGLLVQMVGRGTRLSLGKTDCLVLDYGGNIMRHGPVDMIQVKEPGTGGGGEAPAKMCPQCRSVIFAGYLTCPDCGYVFPPSGKNKTTSQAESSGILSGQTSYADYEVKDVYYAVHQKFGAPDDAPKTMRIDYHIGIMQHFSEWVCPEHTGWVRAKFESWWRNRSKTPPPRSAEEAVKLASDGALAMPRKIVVKSVAGEKYDQVVDYELSAIPAYSLEPGWDDSYSGNDDFSEDSDEKIPF